MSTLSQILIYALVLVILVVVAVRFGRMSQLQGYRFPLDLLRPRAGVASVAARMSQR